MAITVTFNLIICLMLKEFFRASTAEPLPYIKNSKMCSVKLLTLDIICSSVVHQFGF
jgi:hypothetical protein